MVGNTYYTQTSIDVTLIIGDKHREVTFRALPRIGESVKLDRRAYTVSSVLYGVEDFKVFVILGGAG